MRIAILGSTGYLGTQILETLELLNNHRIILLAARRQTDRLVGQLARHPEAWGCLLSGDASVRSAIPSSLSQRMIYGHNELESFLLGDQVDGIFFATASMDNLFTFWNLMKAGKTVWMASKEILIALGDLFRRDFPAGRRSHLIPLDSEHNAIWQMMHWVGSDEIKRIFLTASGGPFYEWLGDLNEITPEMALSHPNWKMGTKISVDSAHLINKGFEVIEASLLFDLPFERIEVVVQRESVIHALVELNDGFLAAVLSRPDMRSVILNASQTGTRRESPFPGLDLTSLKALHFDYPVSPRFSGYYLTLEAGKRQGGYPAFFCGADEACVNAFIEQRIPFGDILGILDTVLEQNISSPQSVGEVWEIYREGYRMADLLIEQGYRPAGKRWSEE